jgi:hypothetical protein
VKRGLGLGDHAVVVGRVCSVMSQDAPELERERSRTLRAGRQRAATRREVRKVGDAAWFPVDDDPGKAAVEHVEI